MSSYWLPCRCGQQIRVSTAQAGETVACVCGERLEVPTLRGLRELVPAESDSTRAGSAWENRHRSAFVCVLVAIASLGLAGYLTLRLPPPPVIVSAADIEDTLHNGSVEATMAIYQKLREGLAVNSPAGATQDLRALQLWGIGIAAAVAVVALIAAAVALGRGRATTPSRNTP